VVVPAPLGFQAPASASPMQPSSSALAAAHIDEEDIAYVIRVAMCTRAQAVEALNTNNGDSFDAILDLIS
jgi:NACalpha-BTF3-like transcription factor